MILQDISDSNVLFPPQKGLEFPEGRGFCKTKKLKEVLLEFQEGWGGVRKNLFHGRGLDIFWNYAIHNMLMVELHREKHPVGQLFSSLFLNIWVEVLKTCFLNTPFLS